MKSIDNFQIIQPGIYNGYMSAYYLQIIFNNKKLSGKIKMDGGVRGINVKCKVKVNDDGFIFVI